jgi:hypothetical protein
MSAKRFIEYFQMQFPYEFSLTATAGDLRDSIGLPRLGKCIPDTKATCEGCVFLETFTGNADSVPQERGG